MINFFHGNIRSFQGHSFPRIALRVCFAFLFGVGFALGIAPSADASSISLSPSTGTFTVGSTFDVRVMLDTQGDFVNALDIFLRYSADKIQLVTPSVKSDVIRIWTSQPRFDNVRGEAEFNGGIPNGTNTSSGVVTTLTFRVKSTGTSTIRFGDETKVLLNDGRGTDSLSSTTNGIYTLILPPPAGPVVASDTHPDQTRWYSFASFFLQWAPDADVHGYSYILSKDPLEVPDDISEGLRTNIAYRDLESGQYYFHIKALRDGTWGGITHFGINIDTEPPALFPLEIAPSARTGERQPILKFFTTDRFSGVDHYELKVIPLQEIAASDELKNIQQFFIEAESPYIFPHLELGRYDVLVRAFDEANNYQEITKRLAIVEPIVQFATDEGIELREGLVIPWPAVWAFLAILIVLLLYALWHVWRWHHRLDERRAEGQKLPGNVRSQLDELNKYRTRYGKMLIVLLAFGFALGSTAFAQIEDSDTSRTQEAEREVVQFEPPIVTTVSRNIGNDEIFYVGGATSANVQIIIYLQNLETGETSSYTISSDKRGEWFYRHGDFLPAGNYLLWVQSKVGPQVSPPSPQIQLTVRRTALQVGTTRISYELFYLGITVILLVILVGLATFLAFHTAHARRKHAVFLKEIREAEESVKRGFAVLRRDIEAELAVIKKAKLGKALSEEQRAREMQLLKDLEAIERYITKEVWEVEQAESR